MGGHDKRRDAVLEMARARISGWPKWKNESIGRAIRAKYDTREAKSSSRSSEWTNTA